MEEVSENVTADADGDGKAARFVITVPPRELSYLTETRGNLLLS